MRFSLILGLSLLFLQLSCVSVHVALNGPTDWVTKDGFESVDETKPHGRVRVLRSHLHMFALLDGKHIFPRRKTGEVVLRVSPGLHYLEVQFLGGFVYAATEEPLPIPVVVGGNSVVVIQYDSKGGGKGEMSIELIPDILPAPLPPQAEPSAQPI